VSIVTLLTDFGSADGYVAEVKGRLLSLVPGLTIVDVTHDIPPGDIQAAAWVLGRTWRAFPAGSVHLAVVDPGVGTPRRALAAETAGHRFVAPDNGLLTFVMDTDTLTVVDLPVPSGASATFHGRDLFARCAAELAGGARLASLGSPALHPVRLAIAPARRVEGVIAGVVVHVDRFGTLITNILPGGLRPGMVARVAGHSAQVRTTFGDVGPGELVAFVGSGGTLEIAVRDGRADATLGVARGADVTVGEGVLER
jgi:hypothetical protein